MPTASAWRGNPLPTAYTLITAGSVADYTNAVVPQGILELDRVGSQPVSLTMYGGTFSTGLSVYAEGVGGDVDLNLVGGMIGYDNFYSYAPIVDRAGVLDVNVSGGEFVHSYGSLSVAASGMLNDRVNLTLSSGAFANLGLFSVDGTSPNGLTSDMDINAGAGSSFVNSDLIKAVGAHGSVNQYGAGSLVNNGVIDAEQGAQVSFQGSGLSGTGTVEAQSGSRIQVGAPVGSGETFSLTGGSVLEFWTPPKMSFMASISNMDASDTILIDQAFATHLSFGVISQAGAGLSRVAVYDTTNTVVAALTFVGHFNASDFSLTPHASPTGNWTALTFTNNPNVGWIPHS